jgi:hypothetical protein
VSADSRKMLTGREYTGGTSPHIDTTVAEEKSTRNNDDNDTTDVAFLS